MRGFFTPNNANLILAFFPKGMLRDPPQEEKELLSETIRVHLWLICIARLETRNTSRHFLSPRGEDQR